jgi:uncharacterized membrane protein SpoIIM required for sporulation
VRIESFVAEREPDWRELEALVRAARGRADRLPAVDVARLGRLYRTVTADLALARRSLGSTSVTRRLERLAAQSRPLVYARTARPRSLASFVAHGYWRDIRSRPAQLLVMAALLAASTILAAIWAIHDQGAALGAVPTGLAAAGDPSSHDPHLAAATAGAFSSQIFTNNIEVAILEFASGLLLGVGSLFVIAYNGLILGVVIGLAIANGHGSLAAELLIPHGVLELSLNVVCATAGMRMGWAIIKPGSLTRLASLQRESRGAIGMLLGTIPWFVLCGLIEGFVTPHRIGVAPALVLGISLGALFWGLVWRLGTPPPSARPAPAP